MDGGGRAAAAGLGGRRRLTAPEPARRAGVQRAGPGRGGSAPKAPVADAVGDRAAVICDGGLRRGSDIVKAVAAGAAACMAGRAYLYALAAAGERGVDRLLTWLHNDMLRTMTLLGVSDVSGLERALLEPDPTP